VRSEDRSVRDPIGETLREFIGEIAVWGVLCLVGGAFVLIWGEHPVLFIVGIAAFAFVSGWVGYLSREVIEPHSTRARRVRTALTAGVLGGLCAFAVSLLFCSCT
jgi:hypothetical protein